MKWCAWQDSNMYAFRHQILSLNQYFNYQLVKFLYTVCTPVSYTHLDGKWFAVTNDGKLEEDWKDPEKRKNLKKLGDVYKRQGRSRRRRPAGRVLPGSVFVRSFLSAGGSAHP